MQNEKQSLSTKQKTLRQAILYVGVGLHTGKRVSMVISPAEPNNGIHFVRRDAAPGTGLVAAKWYNVVDTKLCTVLGNEHGVTVTTVEHLLAALNGCGIDNAIIELDGPEVPIMDGSSNPFVSTIERVGTVDQDVPRNVIWIQQPLEIRDGDRHVAILPSKRPMITVGINFPNTLVGAQTYSVELVNEAFRNDVARARTFGFAEQVDALQKKGFALGGSLKNAVLVDGDRIVNGDGLRYPDEFVRHKILDVLGDMTLAGVPVIGHFYAYKPGHDLNNAIIKRLFEERSAWSYIPMDEFLERIETTDSLVNRLPHADVAIDDTISYDGVDMLQARRSVK